MSSTLIEQDTGGGWSIVSSPNPSSALGGQLSAVTCASAGDCWAVGDSGDSYAPSSGNNLGGEIDDTLIEQYTGSGWTIVSSPNPSGIPSSRLSAVTCASASDCWAVGFSEDDTANNGIGADYTLIEQYTGSGWSIVSSPNPSGSTSSQLSAVTCVSASDCWAVGVSGETGGSSATLIEHDTGSGWSIVPSSTSTDSSLSGVSCVSASDCWAVGVSGGSGVGQALIEQYTGSGWSVVPSPAGAGSLNAVTCVSASDCWATGLSTKVETGGDQYVIEQYTGSDWSIVSTPSPSSGAQITLSGVTCISASDCWAVGSSVPSGGNDQTLIEQGP
jgi:hypothetical protein